MTMTLLDYISNHLENVRRAPDGGITAGCPVCIAEGSDKGRVHLRVWASGAFNCSKAGPLDKDHNRQIRSHIRPDSSCAAPDYEEQVPEQRLDVERVYPESVLGKLIPDYSYWIGRGVKEDVLKRLGGGVAPLEEKSKLSGRYVIPIRDDSSRIVGFTGRLVSPNSFAPSWKHLFKSSRVCWPWSLVGPEIKIIRKVVLLESVGDWLTLASHDMRYSLVLFGLNMNSHILGHLVEVNPTHVIISTNNDAIGKPESKEAGNKAALKVRRSLVAFFGEDKVSIRLPETAKDWNAADPAEADRFKEEVEAL